MQLHTLAGLHLTTFMLYALNYTTPQGQFKNITTTIIYHYHILTFIIINLGRW
jgi:hypothetical protein